MKRLYVRYCKSDIKVQRCVALLPWSHNVYLLGQNLDDSATLYYAQETIEKGWNCDLLLNAIKLNMYESRLTAKVDSSFDRTLPAEQAKYANEVFCSSYNLGFLGVTSPLLELALEDMGKPIGVADYQLILQKEKLQKVLTDEIRAFDEEQGKNKALFCKRRPIYMSPLRKKFEADAKESRLCYGKRYEL